MADKHWVPALTDLPTARPDFNTTVSPILVQMNPDGAWETKKPDNIDTKQLEAVIQCLLHARAFSGTYCTQCTAEGKKREPENTMTSLGLQNQCPICLQCHIQTVKEHQSISTAKKRHVKESKDEKDKKKSKSRGFVLQRLTDFDLLSQW